MNVGGFERVLNIRQRIQDRIGASRYRTWFGDSTQFKLSADGLDIIVLNPFVGRWIAGNFMEELVAATRDVLGDQSRGLVRIVQPSEPEMDRVTVASTRDDDGAKRGKAGRSEPPQSSRRSEVGGPTALRHDLDSFVVGAGSRLAHAAATSVVRDPGRAFKLLLVHSTCGLGKTHLLQGICNALTRTQPQVAWRYVTGEEFTNEFIFAVKAGRVDAFRARFRKVDVLAIDDIHFLANKKATQEEFLHTYNAVEALGKAVVLSSDCHPRAITTLSEPLKNRLLSGMVVQIDPPDAVTRLEILERRAAVAQSRVPDAVLRYLAEKSTRSVREMEGAMVTLIGLSALSPESLTLDAVDRVLADSAIRTRPTPEPLQIARVVAARLGVTVEQILGDSRERSIALARSCTMFLVRRHTSLSFPEIGRLLGGKNHSTVLMATQRVERMMHADANVTWKTIAGNHEASIRALIDGLERELFPAAAAG